MKRTNILRAAVITAAAASATATAVAQAATPTAHASRVAKVQCATRTSARSSRVFGLHAV